MKNAIKFGFLAVVMTLAFAACNGSGSSTSTDSTQTDSARLDSAHVDSAHVDSTKKM